MTHNIEADAQLRRQVDRAIEEADFTAALDHIKDHRGASVLDKASARMIQYAVRQLETEEMQGVIADDDLLARRAKLTRRISMLCDRVTDEAITNPSQPVWFLTASALAFVFAIPAYFFNRYVGHAFLCVAVACTAYCILLHRRAASQLIVGVLVATMAGLLTTLSLLLPNPKPVVVDDSSEPPPVQTSDLANQLSDIGRWAMETFDNREDFIANVYDRWPKDDPRTRDFGELAIIHIESRPNPDDTWSLRVVPTACEFDGGQQGAIQLQVPIELLPGGVDFDHTSFVPEATQGYRRASVTCTITDVVWEWGFTDGRLIGFATEFETVDDDRHECGD
ncbi:MAG: hypothetical protein AAFU85_26645 [Planctomycetota bacterium]